MQQLLSLQLAAAIGVHGLTAVCLSPPGLAAVINLWGRGEQDRVRGAYRGGVSVHTVCHNHSMPCLVDIVDYTYVKWTAGARAVVWQQGEQRNGARNSYRGCVARNLLQMHLAEQNIIITGSLCHSIASSLVSETKNVHINLWPHGRCASMDIAAHMRAKNACLCGHPTPSHSLPSPPPPLSLSPL